MLRKTDYSGVFPVVSFELVRSTGTFLWYLLWGPRDGACLESWPHLSTLSPSSLSASVQLPPWPWFQGCFCSGELRFPVQLFLDLQ